MVVTLLEAEVRASDVDRLEAEYREIAADLPDVLVETFLIRETGEKTSFGILTIWSSLKAVQEMRRQAEAAGSKPGGVLVFESVGATPTLRMFDVLHHGARDG